MERLTHLLQKFWNNQISLTELQQLHELLNVHKDELTSIENVNFEQIHQQVNNLLSNQQSTQILNSIHKRIHSANVNSMKPVFVHTAQLVKLLVAASIIGIICIGVQFFNFSSIFNPNTTTASTSSGTKKYLINTGSTNQQHKLEDGSLVTLQPGAFITYEYPFNKAGRNIFLNGNAYFKVFKNKHLPFTVFAQGIATTALGTEFWIYASNVSDYKVILVEGKVVIKNTVDKANFAMKQVYLVAGQQFQVNLTSNQYAVTNSKLVKPRMSINHTPKQDQYTLQFTDEPLENVLVQIQNKFHKKIIFHKEELKGRTFSGSFVPTDNIQVMLSVVCNMNELAFTNTSQDSIFITAK